MIKPRKKSSNCAFGFPTPCNPAKIPSKANVIRHMQFIRQEQTTKRNAKLSAKECQRIASNDLQNIWASFSFPTISYEGICLKAERLMERASKLNKLPSKRRTNKSFLESLTTYKKMFDIQSNFDTMPPFGTERKWHSSEGGIVTRICKNSLVM